MSDFDDYKNRIANVLHKFHEKDLREIDKLLLKKKPNKKPEKLVEEACLKWMRSLGWFVNVFEAKASLTKDGIYKSSRMKPGTPDIIGVTPDGIPVFIELKAKDRRSMFNREDNVRQQEFINRAIDCCSFAVVVDSVERLEQFWDEWNHHVFKYGKKEARKYLYEALPKKK